MDYFVYGETEIAHLKACDPILGKAIEDIGPIRRRVTPDLFAALFQSIVGQQISTKAQATIMARMEAALAPITAEKIDALTEAELQSFGISFRKASYIKEIAGMVARGEFDLSELSDLSDDEVSKRLSQLKGIGIWTAEMLMIFSMQRPNIFSYDDLAILRGLRMLYRHRKITPALFAKYRRRYAPYASVASLYLWAIAGGACPKLTDHAPLTEAQKKKRRKEKSQKTE